MAQATMVPNAPPDAVQVKLLEFDAEPPDAAVKVADCLVYPLPTTSLVSMPCSKFSKVLPVESDAVKRATYTDGEVKAAVPRI